MRVPFSDSDRSNDRSRPSNSSMVAPQLDNVLGDIANKRCSSHHGNGNIRDHFTLGRELGEGPFWSTCLCIKKSSVEHFACKSIPKTTLTSKGDQEAFRRGIEIMDGLKGKDNIARIVDAFEDHMDVHIVMEPCSGGDLFECFTQWGGHSEKYAALLMKMIVGALDRCHSVGVMLRVLNHKTFMFSSKTGSISLKLVDLGRCVTFQPGPVLPDNISHFRHLLSEAYCIAPEVVRGCCGVEADVWSAGVLMYMLLSGVPPFWAETEEIFDAAMEGRIDFQSDPWPTVTESAKSLIRKMLCTQPSERLTARKVISHPWISESGVAPDDRALGPTVISGLKEFISKNEAKKKECIAKNEAKKKD